MNIPEAKYPYNLDPVRDFMMGISVVLTGFGLPFDVSVNPEDNLITIRVVCNTKDGERKTVSETIHQEYLILTSKSTDEVVEEVIEFLRKMIQTAS